MSASSFTIADATSPDDLRTVATLFTAYAEALGIDLCFQDFATELQTLPGKYAAPHGALLLARGADGTPLGCVALRPSKPEGYCEMKRLYVSPAARGMGLGEALATAILAHARAAGYRSMHLDSIPQLTQALALYRKLGFTECAPYYDTPLTDTVFLTRSL